VRDVFIIAITPAALIAGALVGTRRMRLDARSELGLQLPSTRHALLLTAAFLVLLAIHETLYRVSGLNEQQSDWGSYSAGAVALRVVFVALVYPVAEEFFFRGFLLGLITRKAGVVVAVVVTALFFTALHMPHGWVGPLLIFVDGLFFGFARVRSGSLLLPVAFHVLGNSLAVLQRL
jgi:membrane protease YdiL (CAAX protease family)